jgi:putative tRNA adenosine deaminase-associated protein
MSETSGTEVDEVDVAVLAYRDEGDWVVDELPDDALDSVRSIAQELQRYADEDSALALVSVAEDFALLVRVQGATTRVLLSDASAATEWTLARSVVELLGLPLDDEEAVAAGDVGILADLGMPASELGELLDDDELYPEELLSEVADAVGFGPAFDDLVDLDD